jgi:glycerol-3-phosphate dehydrogenase (NAD(P)+)
MMANVAIVGAGLMGTATAFPLSDNGHSVRLVGTHLDGEIIRSCKEKHYHPRLQRELPPSVHPYYVEEMTEALEGVEIILSGVNSYGVHWVGKTLGPHLKPGQSIIAITKGLEATAEGDPVILPDVLAAELPPAIRNAVSLSAVAGPCIAGELAGRRHSCVVFGSRDGDAVERLAAVFRTPYYHVWTTTDLVGLEFCAALKNAYTLGVGMVLGLLESAGGTDSAGASMHNLAAANFAQSCFEMERILKAVGGSRTFATNLPTPGDLYVTCVGGRTVRMGKLLGLGHTYSEAREIMAGETLEGAAIVHVMAKVLPRLVERGSVGPAELPLLRTLIDVIVRGKPLKLPFDEFFGGAGRV